VRALVTTGNGDDPLHLDDVPEAEPRAHEAVVAVHATSLNRGEVKAARAAPAGARLGWDLAGVVATPAADGSGPAAGTRVVGMVRKAAWAERVAVPARELAALPDGVDVVSAAALPVAGITALRALALGGLLLGRRVLVTGASGGVGRFAVQLAAAAGADVTGVVGRPERAEGLEELGAAQVAIGIESAAGPYDLVLESVGGASLVHALSVVAPGGTVVSYGRSAEEPAALDPRWFLDHNASRLVGLLVFEEVQRLGSTAQDLSTLAGLVAAGRLDPQVSIVEPWENHEGPIRALIGRQVAGKAVLRVADEEAR
jgi:NADPH:quinone reductase-like Zn-dependent oxidoreductase